MKSSKPIAERTQRILLGAIALLFVIMSTIGITWGLPSRSVDKYLFAGAEPWSGEKIYRLAGAADKFSPTRGADVDLDPLNKSGDEPILLTETEADVAKIYLRYRLYTYQPDEMITMMALAGMKPRQLRFDPKLYQYGGLFIYPIGGLIGACGMVGLIDLRGDIVFYLDNPDEFGKFYIVARAYSAVWGLVGVLVVFAIARRLCGSRAGLLAAAMFALMPVVVCMAHEGKPHLPGAVLMLMAVLFGMRHLSRAAGFSGRDSSEGKGATKDLSATTLSASRRLKPVAQGKGGERDFWVMCVCCGASLGMVLSSWPIFVLIPLVVWLASPAADGMKFRLVGGLRDAASRDDHAEVARRHWIRLATRVAAGVVLAAAVYLVTNPYVLINALTNREVLASNFGNSMAMYQITHVWAGFVRVLELTVEGATLPMPALGVVALCVGLLRTRAAGFSLREDSDVVAPALSEESRRLKPAAREDNVHGNSSEHAIPVMLPLVVSAAVFFMQFVLIGAGKPGEYGRFGIFPNTALAIGAACLLAHPLGRRRTGFREIANWLPATIVCAWIALQSSAYVQGFALDAGPRNSRLNLAQFCTEFSRDADTKRIIPTIGSFAEPAPYCFPPIDFAHSKLQLIPIEVGIGLKGLSGEAQVFAPLDGGDALFPKYAEDRLMSPILASPMFGRDLRGDPILLETGPDWRPQTPAISPVFSAQKQTANTPMSWANKPFYDSVFFNLTSREAIPLGR